MNLPDYLFLLGGADLEMLTIRKLLSANGFVEGVKIAANKLQWVVKLIEYHYLFDAKQTFVSIEQM